MAKPITTLFLLTSIDGKITLGSSDNLDFDKDIPQIEGAREGLHQYYEIEKTTDLWSLCSGKVQAKLGVNSASFPEKSIVNFVIIDNNNLKEHGIRYFLARSNKFVLVTTNRNHPAFHMEEKNLNIIFQKSLNLTKILDRLHDEFGCENLTIQTGGTLNSLFLRENLINFVDIIIAPILVGGSDTASLIDGISIKDLTEINKIKALQLNSITKLNNSYIRLRYSLLN